MADFGAKYKRSQETPAPRGSWTSDVADAGIAETGCVVCCMPSGTNLYRNVVELLRGCRALSRPRTGALPTIALIDSAANGRPWTFTCPSWRVRPRSSAGISARRSWDCDGAAASPGRPAPGSSRRCDRRPSHLPSRARLRSRAAFSLATRLAFSNCAMAPSTWRTRTAVGVSSRKKSGADAGMRSIPSPFSMSWPASWTARSRANRSGLSTMIVRIYKGMLTSLFGMWKSHARPSAAEAWLTAADASLGHCRAGIGQGELGHAVPGLLLTKPGRSARQQAQTPRLEARFALYPPCVP